MLIALFSWLAGPVLGASLDVCGACAGPMIGCGICGVFWLGIYGAWLVGWWKMFVKAGEPGWAAIVPIYNVMIMAKISGREPTEGLMCLIPIYGIYVMYLIDVDVARAFGKEQGFAILMLLVPFVAFPMLGFGDARYRRVRVKPRRDRRDYDDED
jgi:hypothetical protein